MTAYNRKKISELEDSLYGKKIEVLGKIVEPPFTISSIQFYTNLQDIEGNVVRLRGEPGLFWKNKFEKMLDTVFATNVPVIAKGTYQYYGWSDNRIHIIAIDSLKIVDYLRLVK